MPTIAAVTTRLGPDHFQVKWGSTGAGLDNGDDGAAVQCGAVDQGYVQVTEGTVGTIVLEGSQDGTTFAALEDGNGAAISLASNALERLENLPRYVRPRSTAGSSDAVVILTYSQKRLGA
jgi:hypothetical protein